MSLQKVAALFGAALLSLSVVGVALGHAEASDPVGITPTVTNGNITIDGQGNSDQADCAAADALHFDIGDFSGDPLEASGTTSNADDPVTVTAWYDEDDKEVSFEAEDGIVTIAYVKGGNAYNTYDYTEEDGGGVDADGHLHAPVTGQGEGEAGLSHVVFCTGQADFTGDEADLTQSTTDTLGSNPAGHPADNAWLLVVALGVLLASLVVLSPARSRR